MFENIVRGIAEAILAASRYLDLAPEDMVEIGWHIVPEPRS